MMEEHRNIETIGWVVHDAKEDFKLEELILDGPQDDELLVDMKFSGICHTVSLINQTTLRDIEPVIAGSSISTRRDQRLSLSSSFRT